MIIKFLIVALCMLSGTMLGLFLSKKLVKKALYYESLTALINTIISEVKFRKNITKNILKSFVEQNDSQLNIHLNEYISCENFNELKLSRLMLKPAEIEDIKKFLLSLGTADSDTQIFELENYKTKFSTNEKFSAEQKKKFSALYIKLGFFLGLALGILII